MEPICLHLNCISGSDGANDGGAKKEEVASRLESVLWGILGSEGRSEVRMCLCKDLGTLRDVPRELQASIFLSLIWPAQSTADELLCRQVLQVACERQPRLVMHLFDRDSKLIRNFFSGHPKRILDWFENFQFLEKKKKELGAQALAQFAFVHREKFWKELEWKGSHGQAPATLASKPHYFLDLDVLKTVENFLDGVPEFWSSDELWGSLREGDILALDVDFFVRRLFQRMQNRSSSVWKMLEQFFLGEDFSLLCQRLLSFMDDQKLLQLVNKLSEGLMQSSAQMVRKTGKNGSWLVKALAVGAECPSLECAMLCNAFVAHPRQLLRVVQDGEIAEDSDSFKSLLMEMTSYARLRHQPFWRGHLHWNKWELIKVLALESWAIYVLVSKDYMSITMLEDLLSANSIQFENSLLKRRQRGKKVHKGRKKRKKKRRKSPDLSSDEGQISDQILDDSVDYSCVSSSGPWYLSLDNYKMGLEQVCLSFCA
ncbi:hypothetical protein KP509_17G033400 [Ceratopteris richardii]|uniref:Uncharacterized protein n=1 Tax=Ceratopteris richardii TaxID=49495 RepID=A0A8T2SWW5_CERRI|nr:hypothetical protein KP509_17G033400 [Ceratopteris richardii]